MPKKEKKHGREVGGVIAGVTKHAPKFTNDNVPKESPKDTPDLSAVPANATQSPDLQPVLEISNGHSGASPLLDAVSTTSGATSSSPSMNDWTRRHTLGMAGSPGNLISLAGSPQTQPSSYEDPRAMPSGWSSPRPSYGAGYGRPLALGASPPVASPPSRLGGRALDIQLGNRYSPPAPYAHIGSAAAARRGSTHSHFSRSPNPPLPHQPQAHFYGVPNLDNFDLPGQSQSGIKAGERGYYFGFDTLSAPGTMDHGPGKDNVVLAGYEGGLEVYSVGQRGREHIASLKGLRGALLHAKIVPCTLPGVVSHPLVAVVVHGPAFPLPAMPDGSGDGDYDAVSTDRSDDISNVNQDMRRTEEGGFIESYQTTVEIWSLKTNKLVQVLLEAPKVPLKTPITSPIFKPPPPSGAFSIKADNDWVVVSSGQTGECWVYRQMVTSPESPQQGMDVQFACVGKVWTSLQPAHNPEIAEAERHRAGQTQAPLRPPTAIVSLKSGLLVYCPAAPQSQIALRASVPVPIYGKAPLLNSLTPPHLPPVNAVVDWANGESVVNRIMRDATQGLIEGGKLVAKHGMQAWGRYWNPQATQVTPSSTQTWAGGQAAHQESMQFPPTHGSAATLTVLKEPGLISILDVETLASSGSLHPLATYQVPHGCSFLSLAPSGQLLFTASSKGDVQTVWDLMRTENSKSAAQQSSAAKSAGGSIRIRQVGQFSRMTVARIVDVSWTKPNGERAAMVTERGTVHLFDLPSNAFTWPPPRRRVKEGNGQGPHAEGGPAAAVAMASNALNTVRGVAGPLISRHRRSMSNAPPLTGHGFVDSAAQGGRALVAGISHSFGGTVNQLRHRGDNRVALPPSPYPPGSSCVAWVRGRKDYHLFVLGDGLVRTFPAKRSKPTGKGEKRRVGRLTRDKDLKLPKLPADQLPLLVRAFLDPEDYPGVTQALAAGNASLGSDTGGGTGTHNEFYHNFKAGSAIPQAEIESSAPYQPFHTDRRVALYECYPAHTTTGQGTTDISMLLANPALDGHKPPKRKKEQGQAARSLDSPAPTEAWVFGQSIQATKLDLGIPLTSEEDNEFNIATGDTRALPASAMETVYHHVGDHDEQIVVTTRRRKGGSRAAADLGEDGFFEDDCEVLDFADQRV